MFRGPSFIVSTMREETTPIFKRLWYDWTQQQPGTEPTNPLGQCWVPPIVAYYDQQGATEDLFVTRGLHQEPPPRIPTGLKDKKRMNPFDHKAYIKKDEEVDTFEELMVMTFKMLKQLVDLKYDIKGLIGH